MSKFNKKKQANGSKNPDYVDLLFEDPVIPHQKYVCISFVSPETIIKQREQFLFEKFAQQWDFAKSIEKFGDFMNFISHKYKLKLEDIMADMKDFVTEEKAHLKSYSVSDDYKNFMDKNEDRLNEEFNKEHEFQTSVRGIKVRGSFSSEAEAELRAKKMREVERGHDVLVGKVGVWMPWDPDAYKTGRVEFLEEELNQLYQEKLKNEEKAKQEFDQRVMDAKRKAIEENVRKARESGNKLTQSITEDGQLVGVKETVNFEERDLAEVKPISGSQGGVVSLESDGEASPVPDKDSLDRVD